MIKWFYTQKLVFFSGKTKTNKTKHFVGNHTARLQKDVCFDFSWEKVDFPCKNFFFSGNKWFSVEKQFFPGKQMGFGLKNKLFPGRKSWFWVEKQILSCEKYDGLGQEMQLFTPRETPEFVCGILPYNFPVCFWLVVRRKVNFSVKNHLFPTKQVGLWAQKPCFLPRKRLGFRPKTILFLGKLGISLQDQILPSNECVFHLWLGALRISDANRVRRVSLFLGFGSA